VLTKTTGLVVVLGARGLMGISTGDSEAWVVTSSTVDNLTVGQHTRLRLGSSRATVTTFQRSLLAGVLVVATDGLFKYAAPDVIARIVRDNAIRAAAQGLVELVRLRSRTTSLSCSFSRPRCPIWLPRARPTALFEGALDSCSRRGRCRACAPPSRTVTRCPTRPAHDQDDASQFENATRVATDAILNDPEHYLGSAPNLASCV
jgi:hypothetical protein